MKVSPKSLFFGAPGADPDRHRIGTELNRNRTRKSPAGERCFRQSVGCSAPVAYGL
jgi:hypothetical protein